MGLAEIVSSDVDKGTGRAPQILPGENRAEAYMRRKEDSKKVDALESAQEVDQLVEYFLEKRMFRTACFFVLGCNTGVRPSDLLEFEWGWVLDADGQYRLTAGIVESKTGKSKPLISNDAIRAAVELYRDSLQQPIELRSFMFTSQSNRVGHVPVSLRGQNTTSVYVMDSRVQPVNVRSMSRDIRAAARNLGLYRPDRKVSSYSMRSTALSALAGLVDGVEISDAAIRRLAGIELAKMLGNHAKVTTTSQHYLDHNLYRKQLEPALRELNLGLPALRKYQQKGE